MKLKHYPLRSHVRRIFSKFANRNDSVNYLKDKGIIVHSHSRDDISKIGSDFFFSMKDYLELKGIIDSSDNYKNSNQINIPSKQVPGLKEGLIKLSEGNIIDNDDTKIKVLNNSDGSWKFTVQYTEFKPSYIDLLDNTTKIIEVSVNKQKEVSSLDFNITSNTDHKKIMDILNKVNKLSPELELDLSDIDLDTLNSKELKIQLFDDFFQADHQPWVLRKITKLKVKREKNEKEDQISKDSLEGINSAILSGQNLIENTFIKETIKNGFFFSMATMRFDNIKSNEFIDIVIDLKSRPKRCERKIISSGIYTSSINGIEESKTVFSEKKQNEILYNFNNTLYLIYINLLTKQNQLSNTTIIKIADDDIIFTDEDTIDETAVSKKDDENDE